MQTNGQDEIKSPLQLLYDALKFLHAANDLLVYEIMGRAINNYMFLRANNSSVKGELTAEDTRKILYRIGQDIHEALPLNPGLDTYKPKGRSEAGLHAVDEALFPPHARE